MPCHGCALLRDGQALLGYGIIGTVSGSVAQLAVRPDVRRRGIGTALLHALAAQSRADTLTAINVDAQSAASLSFLTGHGFQLFVSQYEMSLPL